MDFLDASVSPWNYVNLIGIAGLQDYVLDLGILLNITQHPVHDTYKATNVMHSDQQHVTHASRLISNAGQRTFIKAKTVPTKRAHIMRKPFTNVCAFQVSVSGCFAPLVYSFTT